MSSSPPSSPSICADSSPASSPCLDPVIVDSDVESTLHPFAASHKANRMMAKHEKKPVVPHIDTDFIPTLKRPRHTYRADFDVGGDVLLGDMPQPDPELQIWDDAIARVIDSVHGTINLENMQLSYIPDSICELNHFYVPDERTERLNTTNIRGMMPSGRMFTRVATAPANSRDSSFARVHSERTQSIADISLGFPREQIQLFLQGNKITTLPKSLFDVNRLAVLILRANQLTYIPPEIALLPNLRELNVSNNQLRYLPCEMMQMKLENLYLFPNPFIPPPCEDFPTARHLSRSRSISRLFASNPVKVVSPVIHRLPRVIPLTELCLRKLLSPNAPARFSGHGHSTHTISDLSETLLQTNYELPLWEYAKSPCDPPLSSSKIRNHRPIPPHLKKILNICVPGCVYSESLLPANEIWLDPLPSDSQPFTGGSTCSSRHGQTRSIFIRHAEERFSWEETIAGTQAGGVAPVLWRGCQWGCLDFLSPTDENSCRDSDEPGASKGHSDDLSDLEMNDEDAIQVMDVGQGLGGLDASDFED